MLSRPDPVARLDAAFCRERQALLGESRGEEVPRLRQAFSRAEVGRASITRAIKARAPFETYRSRAADLERQIVGLGRRVVAAESLQRVRASPAPDLQAIYAEAASRMDQLLGDPEAVDQAQAHLATLIRRAVLAPDPEAPRGLAAETLSDVGSLPPIGGEARCSPNASRTRWN